MAKIVISIFLAVSISLVSGRVTPTASTRLASTTSRHRTSTVSSTTSTNSAPSSTSTTPYLNPALGGKIGNPGASVYLSNKSIDAVHTFAADTLGRAIQLVTLGDLNLPIGPGLLTVKSPRITDAKFPNFDYELIQPNRVRSRFTGGRLTADGQWQYSLIGSTSPVSSGKYRATIQDGELETLSQLGRTTDAAPIVQTIECKTNFSQFRVEVEGSKNLTILENCEVRLADPICLKARSFYEDAISNVLRKFVKDIVNTRLATFPTRINVTEQVKLDYSLVNSAPSVTQYGIWTGLEGRLLWRGMGNVPFSPAPINLVDKRRALSFGMADYTINTLLHQAHAQGVRFSAVDLLSKSPSIQNQLALNCSTSGAKPTKLCLGSFLGNITNDGRVFAWNDTGDLTYKTEQKAASVFVLSDRTAWIDGGLGNLDILGPITGKEQQRQLLARVGVQVLRGDFTPKWNGVNVTGVIKFTRLTLDKAVGQSAAINKEWLAEFSQFATPILVEMFNSFLNKFAQFPIPIIDGFQCSSPEFIVSSRTLQVDCDIQAK